MKSDARYITMPLILALVFVFGKMAFAQDASTEPPTPIELTEALPSETPTLIPTATPTEITLPTDSPTFTPRPSDTPVEVTAESTAAMPEPIPSAIPSPTSTAQAFPPEPALAVLFSDSFEDGAAAAWALNGNWAAENGVLKLAASGGAASLVLSPAGDEAIQLRVLLSDNSGVQISLQDSGNGGCAALLRSDGQVGLYRAGALLQVAQAQPFASGDWHTLRLSSVEGILRVSIDGNVVITLGDAALLSPGAVTLMGFTAGELLVDDVAVFVPPDQLPPPTAMPSPTFVPTATSVVPTPEVTPAVTTEVTAQPTIAPPATRIPNKDGQTQVVLSALSGPLVVNDTSGANPTSPLDGICDIDSVTPGDQCSLPEAIREANAASGADTINFNIPGSGVQTILIQNTLDITSSVTIDGTTQPGYDGKPLIEIRPSNPDLPSVYEGVRFASMLAFDANINITFRGLAVNSFKGVALNVGNGQNHIIENNFIGTDATGTIAKGNASGIAFSAPNTIIRNNVISGNSSAGISMRSNGGSKVPTGSSIVGNYIGTNYNGTAAIPNQYGIRLEYGTKNVTVGGTTPDERNIISGNTTQGILIIGSSDPNDNVTGVVIQGNYIGTDAAGTAKLANGSEGIFLQRGSGNTIGGTTGVTPGGSCAGACNLISGNLIGVSLITDMSGAAHDNIIEGNFIGTDYTGTAPIANSSGGIYVSGNDNQIGGTTPEARNVISGNSGGIGISGLNASGNHILGNFIGTDTTGTQPLGNQGYGVFIYAGAYGNNIGDGTAAGVNRVAYNGVMGNRAGVGIDNSPNSGFYSDGNLIIGNAIYGNYGLGIDLLPEGATANDTGDGDNGANELQNFPVLNVVTTATTVISGTLNSKANTAYQIEVFTNPACDSSDYGEGESSLRFLSVTTDGSGNASFNIDLGSALPMTTGVSAIAIDPSGNTSEFSACTTAQADLSIANSDLADPTVQGAALTYTLIVDSPAGSSDALNTVVTDPLPAQVTFVSANSSQGTCSHNPASNTVTCDLGTVSADSAATITIDVTVNTALTAASLSNTASVSSDTPDPAPANNSATQPTSLLQANLGLAQTAAPNPVAVGGTLTYTFKMSNAGPVTATNAHLHDVLPANVTFVSANAGGGTCTPGSGVVDCTLTSLAKGGLWTVTIAVSPNAGAQNTTLMNTGTASSEPVDLLPGNNTAVSSVKANTPPTPLAPVLLSPANGAATNNVTPSLIWNPVLNATGYEVQIAANSTFTLGLQTAPSTSPNYMPPALSEGTYYWRVRAQNILNVFGPFSAARSFTVDTTPLIAQTPLLTPASSAVVSTVRPSFTWKAVMGAAKYRIQVDDDPLFGSPVVSLPVAATSYAYPTTAAPLPQGLYYWHVLAIDPAGNEGANWSETRQFTVFIGTAPANGSFNVAGKPAFTWAAVSGTTTYSLEIAFDSDFTSYVPGYPLPLTKTSYTPAAALPAGTLYWRVLRNGETPVSIAYRTVFIAAAPPAPVPSYFMGDLFNTATPTLSWSSVMPPNGVTLTDYEVQLARSTAFTTGLITLTSATPSVTTPELGDGLWYWRVRARFGADSLPGAWSTSRSFTIDTVAPLAPKLSSPALNGVVSTEQPKFTWIASSGASSYRIDIADNAGFVNPIVNDQTAPTTSYTPSCGNGVRVQWNGFQPLGIVQLSIVNDSHVPALLTNFKINWNQRDPGVLRLARVSAVAPPGDPDAMIIWQADNATQDSTPPTVGKTKSGWPAADPAWVQNVTIPTNSVVLVYIDFDGIDASLDTIGMIPQDFHDTAFEVGCVGPGGAINLAQGHYWWRVRAVDKAGNTSGDSLTGEFTIFIGTAPADGSFNATGKPMFTWTAVAGATGYNLEIATDRDFTNPVPGYPLALNKTSYTPTAALPNGTLYWRVVPDGEMPVSAIYRTLFIGAAPAAPTPLTPANAAIVHAVTPQLTWGAVTPPPGVVLADYEIQLARNATFTTGLVTLTSGTPEVTTGTLATGVWYWRVRARFGPGAVPGAWSAVRSFTVKIP